MANLSIQRGNGERSGAIATREWEPLRTLREFLRWDPFAEMVPGFMGPSLQLEGATLAPAFEVKETKDAFVFKADVPGVKESDLDLRLTQNRLTISGKRESEKTEKDETYYAYERSFGSFSRSFTVPAGVDADRIKADLKDGVLTVDLPKRPEAQARKVTVKSG